MTLGNMREQGVRGLAVYCLNHSCRHHTVINVDSYPHEIEVPSFALRMKCSKCGGRRVDVRPNWKGASRRLARKVRMMGSRARTLSSWTVSACECGTIFQHMTACSWEHPQVTCGNYDPNHPTARLLSA